MSAKIFSASLNTGEGENPCHQTAKTIRNIDPDILLEAKIFALQHAISLGDLISRSLDFFMEEVEIEE